MRAKVKKLPPHLTPKEAQAQVNLLQKKIMDAEFQLLSQLYGFRESKQREALQSQIAGWEKEEMKLYRLYIIPHLKKKTNGKK